MLPSRSLCLRGRIRWPLLGCLGALVVGVVALPLDRARRERQAERTTHALYQALASPSPSVKASAASMFRKGAGGKGWARLARCEALYGPVIDYRLESVYATPFPFDAEWGAMVSVRRSGGRTEEMIMQSLPGGISFFRAWARTKGLPPFTRGDPVPR